MVHTAALPRGGSELLAEGQLHGRVAARPAVLAAIDSRRASVLSSRSVQCAAQRCAEAQALLSFEPGAPASILIVQRGWFPNAVSRSPFARSSARRAVCLALECSELPAACSHKSRRFCLSTRPLHGVP